MTTKKGDKCVAGIYYSMDGPRMVPLIDWIWDGQTWIAAASPRGQEIEQEMRDDNARKQSQE